MGYINMDVAMEYLGGVEPIFVKISESFLDSYKDFRKNVTDALKKEEHSFSNYRESSLYNCIHSVKGITLNMGMTALYDATSSVLNELKENIINKEKIASMLDIFDATYSELKGIIS